MVDETLSCLMRRSSPNLIPARILDQLNRWCCVLLTWHLMGLVDNSRPSDISLYHIGCLNLVLENGQTTPLASLVLNSLQNQQQHSLSEVLDAFTAAGAVLHNMHVYYTCPQMQAGPEEAQREWWQLCGVARPLQAYAASRLDPVLPH